MKKIYLLFVAATLAACSAEPVENEAFDSLNATVTGKNKVSAAVAENPMGFYTGQNNGRQLKGTLSLVNDCDNFYLEIKPENGAPEDVSIWFFEDEPELNGGENNVKAEAHFSLSDSDNLKWTFPLEDFDTEKPLLVFVKAWGSFTGANSVGEVAYSEFDFDFSECVCEEKFTYVDNGDMTYTFTYVPEEGMTGAELIFTFAQGTEVSGLDDNLWTNNGNGNAQTWSRIMDLTACDTYSWTVTLEANCSGGSPKSNVWTDFKVNGISKKADQEDKFIQTCS